MFSRLEFALRGLNRYRSPLSAEPEPQSSGMELGYLNVPVVQLSPRCHRDPIWRQKQTWGDLDDRDQDCSVENREEMIEFERTVKTRFHSFETSNGLFLRVIMCLCLSRTVPLPLVRSDCCVLALGTSFSGNTRAGQSDSLGSLIAPLPPDLSVGAEDEYTDPWGVLTPEG